MFKFPHLVIAAGLLFSSSPATTHAVDFEKQIWPILKDHCIKCHGARKQKGGLALHNPKAILAGAGKSKKSPVLIPRAAAKSTLYELVALPKDDDDVMPPDDEEKLTKAQQELLKQWVNEGGKFGAWTGQKARAKTLIETLTASKGDAKAIAALKKTGALVLPVSAGSNLLMVDFRGVATTTNDATLKTLLPLKDQVAWVNLAGSKITDAGMATLASLPNLNQLHLEKTAIGNSGLAKLKNAAQLEYLNVYQTQVSDAGLPSLKSMKNLKRLFVWNSKVTKDGAAKFAKETKIYVNNG